MPDYKSILFDHIKILEFESRKRFKDPAIAIEATQFILNSVDNPNSISQRQKVCRHFDNLQNHNEGPDLERARKNAVKYLKKVIKSRLIDFSRKKFGYIRPPIWVKRKGSLWKDIFQKLCIERLSIDEVTETIISIVPEQNSYFISDAALEIKSRIPDCGNYRGRLSPTADEALENLNPENDFGRPKQPHEQLQQADIHHLLEITFASFLEELEEKDETLIFDSSALKKLINTDLELDTEQQMILKLHFIHGINITETGRRLQLTRDQTRNKLQKALNSLRETYKEAGLEQKIMDFLVA